MLLVTSYIPPGWISQRIGTNLLWSKNKIALHLGKVVMFCIGFLQSFSQLEAVAAIIAGPKLKVLRATAHFDPLGKVCGVMKYASNI